MSNKSKYQYKDPVDYGMKRVKLSRKDHDLIFPKRKLNLFQRYEYYIDDNKLTMQSYTNFLGKTWAIVIAPVAIIFYGAITYFKEAHEVFNERKKGAFVEETVFKGRNGSYEKVAHAVGFKYTTKEEVSNG